MYQRYCKPLFLIKKSNDGVSCSFFSIHSNTLERAQAIQFDVSKVPNLGLIEINALTLTLTHVQGRRLVAIMAKIGNAIDLNVPIEQINYIARVPTRNDKVNIQQ